MSRENLDTGVWFQAGVSGLWYQTHGAAGSIVEVRVDGVRFVPACLDAQDDETEEATDEIKRLTVERDELRKARGQ